MSLPKIITLLLCATVVAGCSSNADIKESLGLNRKAPDEFRVYSRPPLTVPPEFSLRAPGSATDAPAAATADAQARGTVTGSSNAVPSVSSQALNSSGDEQFLRNAGAHRAAADVRTQIQADSETALESKNSSYLINPSTGGEPTVDAAKEAERLKGNKAQSKSPTDGETPVVQPKSKGILGTLGDIF